MGGAVQRRVQGRSRRKLHPVFSEKVSHFSSVPDERAEVHSRQERRHGWAACSSDQGDQQAEEGPQLDWQTCFSFYPFNCKQNPSTCDTVKTGGCYIFKKK